MAAQLISKTVTWIIGLSGGILGMVGYVIVWSRRTSSRNFLQRVAHVLRLLM